MKESIGDNTHQMNEKFSLENNELTLQEFYTSFFLGMDDYEFIGLLLECKLLDKFREPTPSAEESKLLYLKGAKEEFYVHQFFAPHGRRIVVGNPEYLCKHLEHNNESAKKYMEDWQELIALVKKTPFIPLQDNSN